MCTFDKLVVIDNGLDADLKVALAAVDDVTTGCAHGFAMRTAAQSAPGVLDADGRPLIPADELIVIGGGDGPNRAIAYLLANDTPITWTNGGTTATIIERATGSTIVDSAISATHDYVMVMVVRESIGNTLTLSMQGARTEGTRAAGLWFARDGTDGLTRARDGWAVIEWFDDDGTPGASLPDTMTVIAHGNEPGEFTTTTRR